MNFEKPKWAIGALVLMLSACQTGSEIGAFDDPGFGEANRQTYAAQIVDPDPVYTDPNPPTSAENAVDAIDRLRDDNVKVPERISTSEISSN